MRASPDLTRTRWRAEQLVSVQEGPDGELKLSLLGPTQEAAAAAVSEVRGGVPKCPPAISPSPAVALFLVGCIAGLAFLLGSSAGWGSDAAVSTVLRAQQAEMAQLRLELFALQGSIADLITSSATLSQEQLADLLALRRTAPSATVAPDAGLSAVEDRDGRAEEGSLLFNVASMLAVLALLLPPLMLGLYEYNLAYPKVKQSGFNWEEQIEYRIDYYLSNVAGAKPIFLCMITGVLIAVGALIYFPVENLGLGGVEAGQASLHQALWMAWLPATANSRS